jgi:cytochrome c-type biogenesis protein CcmH/NrfF
MIRYVSTCFLAVNTLFASTHLTTACDFSQGAEPSSANHIGFQLHCYVGTVYELSDQ